jgi:hypothetical protein
MVAAILQDVATKVGLEKTFDLLKDFLKLWKTKISSNTFIFMDMSIPCRRI